MKRTPKLIGRQVPCRLCPLGQRGHFRKFAPDELEFMTSFKTGEMMVERGTTVMQEGTNNAHLMTILSGWGFRYKTLEDGRRQILNYVLPGDLVGLQGSILGEMQHSIEMLADSVLCVFERQRLHELYREFPSLAFDITWMAAREERILDEHILALGQRTALERAAYLIAYLHMRAEAVGLTHGRSTVIPLTQQHIADTLGLSIVHTNRTLKRLSGRGLILWRDGGFVALDPSGLLETAGWDGALEDDRPFL